MVYGETSQFPIYVTVYNFFQCLYYEYYCMSSQFFLSTHQINKTIKLFSVRDVSLLEKKIQTIYDEGNNYFVANSTTPSPDSSHLLDQRWRFVDSVVGPTLTNGLT